MTQKIWSQWTKKEVVQESAKYKCRKDFERGCVSAYRAAKAMDVYEEACAHMKGNTRWTPEAVAELASQCKTKAELNEKHRGAYKAAKRWGILDEVFSHVVTKKPNGYWTKERCHEVAMQYEKKAIFQKSEYSAYNAAYKNAWLDEITDHMERKILWKEFQLIAMAGEYETIQAFREAEPNAYMAAHRMGIVKEAFEHMTPLHESWTKERIISLAKQFTNSSEFEKANASAYNLSRKYGWHEEATEHMEVLKKPNGYWTSEAIANEAAKYNSRVGFQQGNSGAYTAAVKMGIIEEISQHMERPLSDRDTIYIWRAVNERYNGNPVYKIGITSARLGKQRITEVTKASGSKAELIVMAEMPGKAVEVEAELLAMGDSPCYTGFGGATEFRALSDSELDKALSMIRSISDELYSAVS